MSHSHLKPKTNLDPNVWYHLSETRVDNYTKPAFKAMLQETDMGLFVWGSQAKQYWQFQPLGKPGIYAVRGSKSQINKQLSVCENIEEVDEHRTRPCMAPPSGAREQRWFVFERSNRTIGLYNIKNGTQFYLDVHPGSYVFLSSNIKTSVYQPAQHWVFTSKKDVNDGAYSTTFTDIPASTITSDGTTRTVTSPLGSDFPFGKSRSGSSADSESSGSGLSSGAAAGIGIAAGLIVIALFFAGCYFFRRRCRSANSGDSATDPSIPNTDGAGTVAYSSPEKPSSVSPYSYHAHSSGPGQYAPIGSAVAPPQEMPHAPPPGELPANTYYNELEATSTNSHAISPYQR